MKNVSKKPLKKAQAGGAKQDSDSRKLYTKSNLFGRSKPISEEEYVKKSEKYSAKPKSYSRTRSMDLFSKDNSIRVNSKTVRPRKNTRRGVTESTITPIKKRGGAIKTKKK